MCIRLPKLCTHSQHPQGSKCPRLPVPSIQPEVQDLWVMCSPLPLNHDVGFCGLEIYTLKAIITLNASKYWWSSNWIVTIENPN